MKTITKDQKQKIKQNQQNDLLLFCFTCLLFYLLNLSVRMKVQLSKDALFESKESPAKQLKRRQLIRQREMRIMRMNPFANKQQANIQVIDPLPLEMEKFKSNISFSKSVQSSKASNNLKKYIIEQEKNLRCIRSDRYDKKKDLSTSREINLAFSLEDEKRSPKEINIPYINEMFKNQKLEYMKFENRILKNKVSKMMHSIDSNIIKSKTFSLNDHVNTQTKKNTSDKLYRHGFAKNNQKHVEKLQQSLASIEKKQDDDIQYQQLEEWLQRKIKRSNKLMDELYRYKLDIGRHQSQSQSSKSNDKMTIFMPKIKKEKQRKQLDGVKCYFRKQGDKKILMTNASYLLFQLNKASNNKDRKEHQLTDLLKNSYQNRNTILVQKEKFYQQQSPITDLSTAHQFKLRKLMNKKLSHRLELSKQQVNKFVDYLRQIKDQYHVILNETILQVLNQVRETLLSGKVMKMSDLQQIINKKSKQDLEGPVNQRILQNLKDMMM